MSDANTSAPSAPKLGSSLARAGLIPAALAHAGIALIVAGLWLIAVNGDAVGYRNASIRIVERPAPAPETYAHRSNGIGLRPSLDLM